MITGVRPLVTDIRHFALDDGPGIRTTVFLKGCPLSCLWCHNPETMDPGVEIAFRNELCIGCGDCISVCPAGAVRIDRDGGIDRQKCPRCGRCAEVCATGALRTVGRHYSVSELVKELLKDLPFYAASGGGVTFSGGEPTLFMDYVADVAKALKRQEVHTAIQTSGYFGYEDFMVKLSPFIDLVYIDVKTIDARQHRRWTEKSNRRILDNIRRLAGVRGISVIPRIPLIPGMTDGEDNLFKTARFLKETGFTTCELLPYNSGGIEKRARLGKTISGELAGLQYNGYQEDRARRIVSLAFSSGNIAGFEGSGATIDAPMETGG